MASKTTLILFFISYFLSSQETKLIIFDKENNKILSYSSIKIIGKEIGTYAYENGTFDLPTSSINLNDTIEFSYIGYKTLKLPFTQLKDTVFLIPKYEELDEIVLKSTQNKVKEIIPLKGKTLDWYLGYNEELATLIKPNMEVINGTIKSIKLPIGKKTIKTIKGKRKVIFPEFNSILEINFYSVDSGIPSPISLLKQPIIISVTQDSDEVLEIDLSKEFIPIDQTGIFMSIEILTSIKKINENSFLPSFKINNSKNKKLLRYSFFRNTFIKNEWLPITERANFSLDPSANLAIGMEIFINKN